MSRRLAKFRMSYTLLADLLRLPEGIRPLRVMDEMEHYEAFAVLIEGPACPCEVPEGGVIPWVEVTASDDGVVVIV